MRLERLFVLAACVFLCTAAANADIATVQQTLDYTDNGGGHTWYFWNPQIIVDHSPFQRDGWQDWSWTHDVQALVPAGATGIDSATLSILAWGVDDYLGETDIIYVNGVQVGALDGPGNGEPIPPLPQELYEVPGQPNGAFTQWSVTSFTLPANVVHGLLLDGNLDVFVDIDAPLDGHRVTIASSTLTVDYLTTTTVPEPATLAVLGLGGLFILRRRRSRPE
jgi:hypothetical protein